MAYVFTICSLCVNLCGETKYYSKSLLGRSMKIVRSLLDPQSIILKSLIGFPQYYPKFFVRFPCLMFMCIFC
ncbi:hypothetical protein HanIR_Chr04g0166171 [Helianthus annuus]|nr:hypothetical protein HanIR_Chr04g0166171 [Helianthus annuus]